MKKRITILATVILMGLFGCQQKDTEPTDVEIGMTAIENELYSDALASFEKAVEAEEDLVEAYRGEGMAYMGLGQYEDAVNSFQKALDETSERQKEARKDIFYYQAAAMYRLEDFAGTVSVCNEILKIAPEGDAYYLRGTCYLEQGETEKAKLDFDTAVKEEPEDYDLYLNIYESYRENKLSAQGDEYLQKALEIESSEEVDSYHKARIYYYLENYEEAQAQLTALVEEKNEDALILMGRVYQAMEDYPHAKNMYEQYIDQYGETPEAYNGMVLADIAQEDYDTALANIEKGLALSQERGKQELYFNQIVAYEYREDFATAKAKAQEYVERYPADEMGKKELAFLQSR